MFGKIIEEREIKPSDEDFGITHGVSTVMVLLLNVMRINIFYYYSKSMNEKTITTC